MRVCHDLSAAWWWQSTWSFRRPGENALRCAWDLLLPGQIFCWLRFLQRIGKPRKILFDALQDRLADRGAHGAHQSTRLFTGADFGVMPQNDDDQNASEDPWKTTVHAEFVEDFIASAASRRDVTADMLRQRADKFEELSSGQNRGVTGVEGVSEKKTRLKADDRVEQLHVEPHHARSRWRGPKLQRLV